MKLNSKSINYNVDTVLDLASIVSPLVGDTVVVTEENRGGVFIYRADGDANDGTIFASSSTGKWHRQYDGAVNVKWFGVISNTLSAAATNTQLLNSIINFLYYTYNGGIITFTEETYYFNNQIIIPSNIEINLCKAIIDGCNNEVALFITGYDNNGTLVNNIDNPQPEEHSVLNAKIHNGTIQNCDCIAIHLYNALMQCQFLDIYFWNVKQAIKAERSFYAIFKNLFCYNAESNKELFPNAGFEFIDNVNIEHIEKIIVGNRMVGIQITNASAAQKLLNCSAEHCDIGIQISVNYVHSIKSFEFDTCYIETNNIGINIASGGFITSMLIHNCLINNNTTGIKADFWWDSSTFKIDSSTSFALNTKDIDIIFQNDAQKLSCVNIEANNSLIPNVLNDTSTFNTIDISKLTLPSSTNFAKDINMFQTGQGIIAKADYRSNFIIPLIYGGDIGQGFSNKVIGASSGSTAVGGGIAVQFFSDLYYRANMNSYIFNITIVAGATYNIAGLIIGDRITRTDGFPYTTVEVYNNSGFIMLNVYTLAGTVGNYVAYGYIRLI